MSSLRSIEQKYADIASAIEERDQLRPAWSAEDAKEMLRRVDELHSDSLGKPAAERAIVGKIYELMHRFRLMAEEATIFKAEPTVSPPDLTQTPRWALPLLARIAELEIDSLNYIERYRGLKALRAELKDVRPAVRSAGWASYLKILDGIDRRALVAQERIRAGAPKKRSAKNGYGRRAGPRIHVFVGGAPGTGKRR
ncbi:hypothetical protein [Arthrobacter humicola]